MNLEIKKNMLPNFYNVLEVKHYINGRIRVHIPSLQNNFEKKNELQHKLTNLNGIKEIKINIQIGSILILFDENIINPQLLIGILLNLMELEDEAFNKKSGKISKTLKGTVDIVDMTIYNKTKGILDLKSVIALFFIGYGLKKVRQNPILPNGTNLLWWGYNLISKGDK